MIVGSRVLIIGKILYGILQCTVPYGTVPYMVRANASIPHVMRIIAFRIFFVFVTIFSSLPAIVTMLYCCPRSSAAARILRLSTTAAPTLLATALLGATVPYIFLFTSDKI
jgi:hypothetical protein